jgi:acylphosphatase
MKRLKITVIGLVQGVSYRYFCHRKATEYGIKGWVRNLYNGNVELEIEGESGIVNDFIKELKVGPVSSRVKNVMVVEKEFKGDFKNFEIKL